MGVESKVGGGVEMFVRLRQWAFRGTEWAFKKKKKKSAAILSLYTI